MGAMSSRNKDMVQFFRNRLRFSEHYPLSIKNKVKPGDKLSQVTILHIEQFGFKG